MVGRKKLLWLVAAIAVLSITIALFVILSLSTTNNHEVYKIAIFQTSSHPCMEEAIKGFKSKFKQNHLYSDKKIVLKYFNPELSPVISKAMAHGILSGKYDMVATFSTPALQIIAKYNHDGKIPHVFGVVNDPYSAGVAINKRNNKQPSHLTGFNTPPPVRRTFHLARLCNPKLTRAGTIINPNDASSMVCLAKAREICKTLKIKLEVARVSNRVQVESATHQLLKRGVEAIFIGGDNTVDPCVGVISRILEPEGIPIFAYIPSHTADGAVLGLGASYFEIGRLMAAIAIEIINGKSPGDIPIRTIMPLQLAINLKTAQTLNANWKIPQKVIENASIVLNGTDDDDLVSLGFSHPPHEKNNPLADDEKRPHLYYINYDYAYPVEETLNGFLAGMKRQGMILGKTYELQIFNTEKSVKKAELLFKMANNASDCDIILLTTTPALLAALKTVKDKPVVFATIADPIAAGAGKSNSRHRKNFTGISCKNNFKKMVSLIKQCFPNAKRIGSLYNPYEKNSEAFRVALKKELESANMQFITIPNSSPGQLKKAMDELIHSKVDVICQINDHLHDILFSSISSIAQISHIPLLGFLSQNAQKHGAVLALSPDFEDGGRMQAILVNQIIRGISPANLPFQQIKRSRLTINLKNAAYFNVKIPPKLLKEADMVID